MSTYTWNDWIDMTPDEVADEHYVRGIRAALGAVKAARNSRAPFPYTEREQEARKIDCVEAIERLLEEAGKGRGGG